VGNKYSFGLFGGTQKTKKKSKIQMVGGRREGLSSKGSRRKTAHQA